jgi:hypothetical protein
MSWIPIWRASANQKMASLMLVDTLYPPLPLCGAYEGSQLVCKEESLPISPPVKDSFEAGVSSLKALKGP